LQIILDSFSKKFATGFGGVGVGLKIHCFLDLIVEVIGLLWICIFEVFHAPHAKSVKNTKKKRALRRIGGLSEVTVSVKYLSP